MKYPLDPATGAMATELATAQNPDGSWRRVTFARTPVQDTDIVRTALRGARHEIVCCATGASGGI